MKEWFMSQGLLIYAEILLLAAGLLTLWITGRNYKRLIREADAMGTSEYRLMKYIKYKVTGYFKIGMHPSDTEALIGRYIKKHRVGPFSLHTWSRLPYLFMTLLLAAGGGDFMYRWVSGVDVYSRTQMLGMALLGTWILFGMIQFVDLKEKETVLFHSVSDYVSNYMTHKLSYEYKDQAGKIPPEQYKRVLSEIAATGTERRRERKKKYYYDDYVTEGSGSLSDEVDAKIVEDVLKEFLC